MRFGETEEKTEAKGKTSKRMTAQQKKEEMERKRKQIAAQNKAKKKKSETLEARMGQVIKPTKDKLSEKQLRLRQEMTDFIKNDFLNELITKAQCYAESLLVGREI